MRYLNEKIYGTVLEVSTDAIVYNLRLLRSRLAPGVGVMPIVKASAYGHGAFEVAGIFEQQGVDYLAVAFTSEGIALRTAGITMPIVVFNADADSFEELIQHNLEPEIYNFETLGAFTARLRQHAAYHYPIHIKLDTGMHRLGFAEADVPRLIAALAEAEQYAHVATIFSHLAAADDPAQDDFTRRQIADFDGLSARIAATLPYPVRRHTANTNGTMRFPEAQFDLVRVGIGLYGVGMEGARRVATLKTRIISISELAAGETVGYSRRGVLGRPSRVATIPIGYADGLNRRLSGGVWSMLVGGAAAGASGEGALTPAPIVGNVCMDSCMIDITDASPDVKVGDEVVIFADAPGNTVEDMAAALGTIPYEVMTSISARVKRIYI
jgi:alanine racemase